MHFTGKQRDGESGLDDFGARYFGSSLGRFTTPDWQNSPAAVPYGDLFSPQSLNLYAYVGNNPETFTDPDGHFWCIDIILCVENTWKTLFGRRKDDGLTELPSPSRPPDDEEQRLFWRRFNWQLQHAVNTINGAFVMTQVPLEPYPEADGAVSEATETAGSSEPATVEIVAQNGTKITGFTEHGVERAVGEGAAGTPGVRAGTKPQAILDALKNPQKITSGVDSKGRPFQIFTGKDARVIVNPQSGKIVSVNPVSAAGAH
jgi:RHS repeat-associated protein